MNILGLNCFGHDSAASLLVDGQAVFAVEEERLNRKKHYGGFPAESVRAALRHSDLKLSNIDHVAFYWKPSISYSRIPVYFFQFLDKVYSIWQESKTWTMEENMGMIHYLAKMNRIPDELRGLFPDEKTKFKFHFLEHHFCHAASAYFCSTFNEAAILTIDGGGEWTTAMLSHGSGDSIKKLHTVNIPYSLGAFYQAISRHLGFALITGPGKLMGLASYGNKNSSAYQKMKKLIKLESNGGFKLDLSYFAYHYTRKRAMSEKFEKEFGPAVQKPGNWTKEELDLAAAAQHLVEDVMIHMANSLYEKTKCKNLALAGGVALNSVANGLLLQNTRFKEIFIQPAAGDSGTSLGAAQYLHHCVLKKPRRYSMKHAFLGPGYRSADCEAELKKSGLPYVKRGDFPAVAAKLLKRGKILGWFQGRLEFGPRALGNRSILASPCIPEMKDVLNARVKFREGFRPFAPIALEENLKDYFDQDYPSPYMLLVYNVLENKKKEIPAVTHVDGTARIQSVNKEENPQMWALISAFKNETGVPVILNTSFNVKGEPIVATPFDAVDSMKRSDIDYLVIGEFIAAKKESDLQTEDFK